MQLARLGVTRIPLQRQSVLLSRRQQMVIRHVRMLAIHVVSHVRQCYAPIIQSCMGARPQRARDLVASAGLQGTEYQLMKALLLKSTRICAS